MEARKVKKTRLFLKMPRTGTRKIELGTIVNYWDVEIFHKYVTICALNSHCTSYHSL